MLTGAVMQPFLQVEKDPMCREVLGCRVNDGSLKACRLESDVVSYVPRGTDREAAGITGGFPCQAGCFCCDSGPSTSRVCCRECRGPAKWLDKPMSAPI